MRSEYRCPQWDMRGVRYTPNIGGFVFHKTPQLLESLGVPLRPVDGVASKTPQWA